MQQTDFDRRYRDDPDPFGVSTRWYERRKQAVVLACLAQERYAAAWDVACGTGALAAALSDRCDRVLATDGSAAAVELTRDATPAQVTAARHLLPEPLPPRLRRPFDLVLVTEVLYYLSGQARERTARLVDEVSAAEAEVVCVNWRHHPADAYLAGADAVAEMGAALTTAGWRAVVAHEDVDFVVASWSRGTHPGARSG
ncbi:MAG TPA: SAM-dependent methyltransferase [Dermatophilaceae bacterium]|nr:SAM-dependent methyltransferase [Dermatophilaceae bacterium]